MRVVDPKHREVLSAANDQSSRPVRVIGLAQRCPVDPPAEMTLLSLDVWTTFMALRWFFGTTEPSDEIDHRLQGRLEWEAEDDLGNHYAGGDYGGGGGNSPHWVKTTWFAPPVHPSANSDS